MMGHAYIRYDVVSTQRVGKCSTMVLCQEHHHLERAHALAAALCTMRVRQQEAWDSVALVPQPVVGLHEERR
jgi:hypothetical protein